MKRSKVLIISLLSLVSLSSCRSSIRNPQDYYDYEATLNRIYEEDGIYNYEVDVKNIGEGFILKRDISFMCEDGDVRFLVTSNDVKPHDDILIFPNTTDTITFYSDIYISKINECELNMFAYFPISDEVTFNEVISTKYKEIYLYGEDKSYEYYFDIDISFPENFISDGCAFEIYYDGSLYGRYYSYDFTRPSFYSYDETLDIDKISISNYHAFSYVGRKVDIGYVIYRLHVVFFIVFMIALLPQIIVGSILIYKAQKRRKNRLKNTKQ